MMHIMALYVIVCDALLFSDQQMRLGRCLMVSTVWCIELCRDTEFLACTGGSDRTHAA